MLSKNKNMKRRKINHEKKTNIRQNARIKGKGTENLIGKAKRILKHRRRNS